MLLNACVEYQVYRTPFLAHLLKFCLLKLCLLLFWSVEIAQDLSSDEAHDESLEVQPLAFFKMLQAFLFPHLLIEILTNEPSHHQLFNDLSLLLLLLDLYFKALSNDWNLIFLLLPLKIKLYEFIFHLMPDFPAICLE